MIRGPQPPLGYPHVLSLDVIVDFKQYFEYWQYALRDNNICSLNDKF